MMSMFGGAKGPASTYGRISVGGVLAGLLLLVGLVTAAGPVAAGPGTWTVSGEVDGSVEVSADSVTVQAQSVDSPGTVLSTVTDAAGRYSFELTNGSWQISVPAWPTDPLVRLVTVDGADQVLGSFWLPTAPDRPRQVGLVVQDSGVLVTWEPALNDGGFPISRYVVTAYDDATEPLQEVGRCEARGAAATSCFMSGLPRDTELVFKVASVNTVGWQSWNVFVPEIPMLVSPPSEVTVTPGDRRLTVRWRGPWPDYYVGGAWQFLAFRVYTGSTDEAPACEVQQPARSCVIKGLRNGRTYPVTVAAWWWPGPPEVNQWSAEPVAVAPGLRVDTRVLKRKATRLRVGWSTVGARKVKASVALVSSGRSARRTPQWSDLDGPGVWWPVTSTPRTRKVGKSGEFVVTGPPGTRFRVAFTLTGQSGKTKTMTKTYRINR